MPTKYLCIAGNFQQSEYWRKSKQIPTKDWIYVSGPDVLHGRNFDDYIIYYCGTYSSKSDYGLILEELHWMEIKSRAIATPPEKWYRRVLRFFGKIGSTIKKGLS